MLSQGVGNIPMETLEQHVYRTMEKKYGLRTLALEHAGMLLQAVDSYCRLDNEVEVFQKIFRNEIEEDFRLVQKELLQSIRDLCLAQIMLRNPNKVFLLSLQFLKMKTLAFSKFRTDQL